MRIAIDLQPCLIAGLDDPAGAYALSLLPQVLAALAERPEVEVHLLANLELAEGLPMLQQMVARVGGERCHWHTVRLPVARAATPSGAWLGEAGALLRASAIAALKPQVELVLHAAAGWADGLVAVAGVAEATYARVMVLAQGLPQLLGVGGPSASRRLWERGVADVLQTAERVLVLPGLAARSATAAGVAADRVVELPAKEAPAGALVAQVLLESAAGRPARAVAPPARPRLAYVSPLPPAASGIADYSAELLPALAQYYEIELIIAQSEGLPAVLAERFPVRTEAWLHEHAAHYDRILYHIGNSPFHAHMVGLLQQHPGTVVLHDFFLGHLFGHLQHSGLRPAALRQTLYRSHGYPALALLRTEHESQAIAAYPCNLEVLAAASSVVVHSEHARSLLTQWYGAGLDMPIHQTGLAHASPDLATRAEARAAARRELNLAEDDVLVCSLGYVGAGKLSRELVQAWLQSALAQQPHCQLVLVGGHQMQDDYAEELERLVSQAGAGRITITGYVPAELYRRYLAAADVAVQLRANSRGETSRAVLDAMAHGLALVVNAHGSAAELPAETVIRIPDVCSVAQIAAALEQCVGDAAQRAALAARADAYVRREHAPARIAARYRDAIEAGATHADATYLGRARIVLTRLAHKQADLGWRPTYAQAQRVARLLAEHHAPAALQRILPDVAVLRPQRRRRSAGAALTGLLLLPSAAEAPIAGSVVRAAQMRRVYAEAGLVVEVAHYPVHDAAGLLRADWNQWPTDQVAELAERLRRRQYDFIQLERGLLWPLYRAAVALLDVSLTPCLVYSSHRDEAAWTLTAPGVGISGYDAELAACADLVLAPSTHEAQRLILLRGHPHHVHVFGNGGQVPEEDWSASAQVYRDYLPQTPYGLIVSDGDAGALEGFLHYLGESLAYLPPDAMLVVAGGLGERLLADARFQRWSGINGSRCLCIGRPDALGLAALRRHAHVLVLPRLARPDDSGPDIKTAEALQDGHWVLATSAALQVYEALAQPMRVHIENEPAAFRRALAACLRLPRRASLSALPALGWHVTLAALPGTVRARLLQCKESDDA